MKYKIKNLRKPDLYVISLNIESKKTFAVQSSIPDKLEPVLYFNLYLAKLLINKWNKCKDLQLYCNTYQIEIEE